MSVHEIGITDITHITVGRLDSYKRWASILRRCYSYKALRNNPSYLNTSVCEEWLTYSNFKKWFDKNYVKGWDIDKDILSEDNICTVYSPSTCMFIPKWLNLYVVSPTYFDKSTPIGVSYDKKSRRYTVKCRELGTSRQLFVGVFKRKSEAQKAWLNKKIEMLDLRKSELDSIHPDLYYRVLAFLYKKTYVT